MSHFHHCPSRIALAQFRLLPRTSRVSRPFHPIFSPFLRDFDNCRAFTTTHGANNKQVAVKAKAKAAKKKKQKVNWTRTPLDRIDQFSLVDAIRYLRAFEVGKNASLQKYEIAVAIAANRNSMPLRGRIQLPHPIEITFKTCVICPPGSEAEAQARRAGAILIGEDNVFEAIRAGNITFTRCFCHKDSYPALQKANLGRFLGPRGLMPSPKTDTVVSNITEALGTFAGATSYRERDGVIRLAVGSLRFTPEQLQANIQSFMRQIREELINLDDHWPKRVHEVVFSSTNGPGFSLNGEFKSLDSIPTSDLSINP